MNDRTKLFESEPIGRAVAKLAVPTVIGQIILVLYNMADTFFLGLTGSDASITAATVCMPAFMFLSAVSNLFGVGGASAAARAMGGGDRGRAAKAASFAFWGCAAVTLIYSLAAYFFRDGAVNLLGGSNASVHESACVYLFWTVTVGGMATSLSALLAHLARAEGRSMQAGFGVALGGVLNIALDPLFMFVLLDPGNEVMGAAVATLLSNVISCAYFLILRAAHRKKSALTLRPMAVDGSVAAEVLGVGLPACLMTLFENVSYAVLDNRMALQGTAMQAGLGVAKKVNMLAHCMARGMAQGVLPLIAYNYAAKRYDRMRAAIRLSTAASVALAGACMAVNLTLSRPLISLFIPHGGLSVTCGAKCLRILSLGGPFSACAYAFISFFQAVGESKKSFLLAILRKGVLDIPMMFALERLLPVYGIVWATPLTDMVCCVAAVDLFLRFSRTLPAAKHRAVRHEIEHQHS